MPSVLNPYISFAGNAREALDFYREVFGGESSAMTYGEGMGATDAPGADLVMHGQLETPAGYTLMVSDAPPGMEHSSGSAISISLSGDDGDALRAAFAALAGSGTTTMPLAPQVWGDEFGMCVDRYGVAWMVNVAKAAA